jgi:hypothetical protein
MKKFINETMYEIILYLESELKNHNEVFIEVLNPNLEKNYYAGEKILINEEEFVYRSYKSWSDLAELLFCKFFIKELKENTIILKFKKLDKTESFHKDTNDKENEKYGENSKFFRINKNEEPVFLYAYMNALKNVKIDFRKSFIIY